MLTERLVHYPSHVTALTSNCPFLLLGKGLDQQGKAHRLPDCRVDRPKSPEYYRFYSSLLSEILCVSGVFPHFTCNAQVSHAAWLPPLIVYSGRRVLVPASPWRRPPRTVPATGPHIADITDSIRHKGIIDPKRKAFTADRPRGRGTEQRIGSPVLAYALDDHARSMEGPKNGSISCPFLTFYDCGIAPRPGLLHHVTAATGAVSFSSPKKGVP